LSTSEVSVYC